MFQIFFTQEAANTLKELDTGKARSGLVKQLKKTIGFLQIDPRHPSLHMHEYTAISNPYDPNQKVFEAYAQNKTPAAYRIFWCYGPKPKQITLIAITPHP